MDKITLEEIKAALLSAEDMAKDLIDAAKTSPFKGMLTGILESELSKFQALTRKLEK